VLRRAGKGYVLGVNANHWFGSWCAKPLIAGEAKHIAAGLPKTAWKRLSAGQGTKGERLYDWAYCELADLDASEYDERKHAARAALFGVLCVCESSLCLV
jgi:SRSO17 transposase